MGAPRVAVVGGGLAGLAAGLDLKTAGATVELFERGRLLGGRATSFVVDGCEVDNGQHVVLACCTAFRDLVGRLGMTGHLHLQERFEALVFAVGRRPGRLRAADLPAPLHLAAGLGRYAALGWRDRVRVARAVLAIASERRGERSLAEWLRDRGQSAGALRAFWQPFFVPALNAPLDEVTVAEAAFVVRTAFLADAGAARFGYLRVPLARLADAAAARLDVVYLRTPVTGLELAPCRLRTADGEVLPFDGVVLAVPPDRLARIVGDPARLGLPPLDGFVARPIVDVHLWHDRGSLGFDFAALLDAPVQWVFEKAAGYLCCSLSAAGGQVERPETELVELCWREVSAAVPRMAGASLRRGAATRSPDATYAGGPRPGPRTSAPEVVIAGSWTDTGWPDTMESAVRSGRAAARALVARAEEARTVA